MTAAVVSRPQVRDRIVGPFRTQPRSLAAPAAVSPAAVVVVGPAPTAAPAAAPAAPVAAVVTTDPADLDGVSLVESLVADAVAGDLRARDRLLAEIHPFVLRYCRGRLGRQESVMGSADDVAQEVCLAVVTALPTYTVKGLSFRAFVYGIAAHKVTDAFRAIGRNRAEPVAEIPDAPVADHCPEFHVLSAELNARLGNLLGRLTPRQREVLVLRIAVGLSAEETAVAVNSTPGAVRVTQHRALNRLRTIVERGEQAGEDEQDAPLLAPVRPRGLLADAVPVPELLVPAPRVSHDALVALR